MPKRSDEEEPEDDGGAAELDANPKLKEGAGEDDEVAGVIPKLGLGADGAVLALAVVEMVGEEDDEDEPKEKDSGLD